MPGGLSLHGGEAVAQVAPLAVRDDPGAWFELGQPSRRTPGPGDVVLMRRDPPVDAGFIHDTLLLGFMQRQGAQVVNDPQGLRDFNEQLAALEFPQCSPPTLVTRPPAPPPPLVRQHRDPPPTPTARTPAT